MLAARARGGHVGQPLALGCAGRRQAEGRLSKWPAAAAHRAMWEGAHSSGGGGRAETCTTLTIVLGDAAGAGHRHLADAHGLQRPRHAGRGALQRVAQRSRWWAARPALPFPLLGPPCAAG